MCSLALIRISFRRPLLWGMAAIALEGIPMLVLGFEPLLAAAMVGSFLAGVGSQVLNLGWDLAMAEHVPDEMLSRAYSYDALGSFVAMPVGQLAYGPLALAFGFRPVLVASAVAYVAVVALVLCSRSVRTLPRAPATPEPAVTTTTS